MGLALPREQPRGGDGAIAVTNGCVATPDGLVDPCTVLIRGERIVGVGTPAGLPIPSGAIELDATGKVVLPGFVDARTALRVRKNPDSNASHGAVAEELARGGVTRFLPTIELSSAAAVEDALRVVMELQRNRAGARLIGLRVEVPLGVDHDEGMGVEEARELLRMAQGACLGTSILVIVPAAGTGSPELIRWAASGGMTVGMAAENADHDCGRRAIEAGARYATGALDALDDLHHREPGAIARALLDDRVTAELLIRNGADYGPALDLVVRAKGTERCILTVENGAHTGGSMPGAVRRVAEIPRIGVAGASRMASESPAALCGEGADLGSIAEGMAADLVLLTREFDVVATLVQGALVYQRDAA
jgi:N-acetylglucosamine-6-phosphate deacetylase